MENGLEYTVVRSKRRTLALEVTEKGLTVRAPRRVSLSEIERFIEKHKKWIDKQREKTEKLNERAKDALPLTDGEIKALVKKAKNVFPERAAYFAPKIGVTYGKITVRKQRTKWGSCSAKGDLSFNCLLVLAPPEVLDCVVVHELCHRKAMNHSKDFYAEVEKVFPEYRTWNKWLKENGALLIKRLEKTHNAM